MIISPTVGRVVWFYPQDAAPGWTHDTKQPFAATVAYVWNDHMVNLSYVDHRGTQFSVTSVTLLQEDETAPEAQFYCTWMPYQVGQAKAHSAS